jgi:hypothetical protein
MATLNTKYGPSFYTGRGPVTPFPPRSPQLRKNCTNEYKYNLFTFPANAFSGDLHFTQSAERGIK